MSTGFEERRAGKLPSPGPFLAEITNHSDPTYMGGVEVVLRKGITGSVNKQSGTYIARYMSPFYGVTSLRHEGNNSGDYNDVQKSYGMWMVPPDPGTTVLVIFIDNDPNQCYWIGCVPDQFQNHMVPGIAATENIIATADQKQKYGTSLLPSAEFHKASQKLNNPNVNKFPKPIHPFADRLLAQGLLADTVRGVTSSSARREQQSGVFGISTPGPLDPTGKKGKIGYEGNKQGPISRLGGSSFVMDDGDSAGQNELVRIRTRTGHQILMHNSQDLIYIANSKGTAWIEMTSDGKLDIYARDSVSIHSEADFNFRADRDINIEAGRNINVSSNNDINVAAKNNYNLIVNKDGKLLFKGSYEQTVTSNLKFTAGADTHLSSANIFQTASGSMNLKASTSYMSSTGEINLNAGSTMKQTSGSVFNVLAGSSYRLTAATISMNGAKASAASSAIGATDATTPTALSTFSLPNRDKTAGWSNNVCYTADPITSIMQRVPTHEPWDQHENNDRTRFSYTNTSVLNGSANKKIT